MNPPPPPAFSLRNIPAAIYVALSINLLGTLISKSAELLASGEDYERYEATVRWRVLDQGCDTAAVILLALGVFELARRYVGPKRSLAKVAAALSLASLGWLVLPILVVVGEPSSDNIQPIYEWSGRLLGVAALASTILLTIAADAWRRVTLAAVGLVLLHATGYWIPVIGPALSKLAQASHLIELYAIGRTCLYTVSMLFVIAALAGDGRPPAPEPMTAAAGLRLARVSLLIRLAGAAGIALLMITGRSEGMLKMVMFSAAALALITMLLFALALQMVAAARADGMPRWRLAIGAALTLWWCFVQLEQVSGIIQSLKHGSSIDSGALGMFAIIGPLVAVTGIALVGSAIGSFATHRGDTALAASATARTLVLVMLTIASIALPAAITPTSLGAAMMLILVAAGCGIASLIVIAGLFGKAADSITYNASGNLPPARVVR